MWGGGAAAGGHIEASTPFPDVIEPAELAALIKSRREALNDEEYLAFWLVARMGMVAIHAYDLTLENVTKDDQGKVVVRPGNINVINLNP